MDSKTSHAREYIAQRAELLGAIRLPENAFPANAGTEVVTDILFLQKREQPVTILPDWVFTDKYEDDIEINRYFIQHPDMILGNGIITSTQYGPGYSVTPLPGKNLGELLSEAISHIEGTYAEAEVSELDEAQPEVNIPADPDVKNFSYTIVDRDVYYRQDSQGV